MPVEFLSDEQVGAYGRFTGELPAAEVECFFYLDDADRNLIARRRSDHHRLGFAVQLGTVRAVGRFLEDPLDVPWPAVEFLAGQLEIGNASCVKKYVQRPQTPYEHAWEIRDRYGYRSFDDPGCAGAFARFLEGRAWTHVEGPVALFEQAAGWLRRNRVLLPGVTVLARQVAAARETAEARVSAALAAATRSVDPGLPERLANLLQVPDGSRVSELERLRRSPRRSSGPEMVKALQRAEQLAVLGAGRVGVDDIPANRQQVLARTGRGSKASALGRLGEPKRTATLVAVVRHLEAAAVDDTLDLLAMLPRLEKASKTGARAGAGSGWASRSGPRRWSRWCGTWRRPRSMTRWTCWRCCRGWRRPPRRSPARAGCCLTSSPLPRTPAPGLMSLRCGRRWSESRRGQSLPTRSIWLESSCPAMTARRTRRCARHWLAGTTRFGRSRRCSARRPPCTRRRAASGCLPRSAPCPSWPGAA